MDVTWFSLTLEQFQIQAWCTYLTTLPRITMKQPFGYILFLCMGMCIVCEWGCGVHHFLLSLLSFFPFGVIKSFVQYVHSSHTLFYETTNELRQVLSKKSKKKVIQSKHTHYVIMINRVNYSTCSTQYGLITHRAIIGFWNRSENITITWIAWVHHFLTTSALHHQISTQQGPEIYTSKQVKTKHYTIITQERKGAWQYTVNGKPHPVTRLHTHVKNSPVNTGKTFDGDQKLCTCNTGVLHVQSFMPYFYTPPDYST